MAGTYVAPGTTSMGGGMEGAERTSREMARWSPPIISPDQQINGLKDQADARGRDTVQNDGYAMGALQTHRDSIVGAQYVLNAQPRWEVLKSINPGFTDAWADEYQQWVEGRFNLLSDSPECWFDAAGRNTLTGMLRLAIGMFLMTGEVVGTNEWLRKDPMRPFKTAVQLVSPHRLSNPRNGQDTQFLRRGVALDPFGKPVGYWFRTTHPGTWYMDQDPEEWKYVPAKLPWGRRQVIHIVEQLQPDQTRGISEMVSALKQTRMGKKFRDVVLQNAVVNASYAAAIESELPRDVVFGALGAGGPGLGDVLGQYMTALGEYTGSANNLALDGVKIPHLFPGTKLSLTPMGKPGGIGGDFEMSLLRHVASSLGLSYEQLSRDYSQTNYSSLRGSMGETWKYMQSRKKHVADRLATSIYVLWLEEQINAGNIPLPAGVDKDIFYDPLAREALCACDWIGASRGQVDEGKETEAALARIAGGLSTYEKECARLGEDFRRIFAQRAREKKLLEKLGLDFSQQQPAQKKPADNANQDQPNSGDQKESK